jgi:hypothetical protein
MRWLLLLASLAAACDTSTTTLSDFGVVLPGCRAPNQCWATDCKCFFAYFNSLTSADPLGCMLCDPNQNTGTGTCDCTNDDGGFNGMCIERAQVCVGQGPPCTGKCVHPNLDMGVSMDHATICQMDGDPPDVVLSMGDASISDGGGPVTERRCAYKDDTCCD